MIKYDDGSMLIEDIELVQWGKNINSAYTSEITSSLSPISSKDSI
jgi:hypothetical protein